MEERIEDAVASELTRGDLIKRAAVAGLGLSALSGTRVSGILGEVRTEGRPGSALGRRALNEAIKNLGTMENPPGSNKTPYGKWFGFDGVSWSNIFVSYCFSVGANYVICSGFKGGGVNSKGCASVAATEAWLRASGMWKGVTTPMPGDIVIYNWDGGLPDHIGIVEAYLGSGRFTAIEGNTSVGNLANDGVGRKLRNVRDVDGFGRVVKR